MMARNVLVLAAAMAAAGLLAGCGEKVSKANYDKIEVGMAREKVESILGEPSEVGGGAVAVPGLEASAKVATWKSEDRTITVTFVNDKVKMKTQSGL